MRVDLFTRREYGDRVELCSRIRSKDGEHRLMIDVPAEFAVAPEDVSYAVPTSILPAAIAGEDLEIDGEVSPLLLKSASMAAAIYSTWDPGLRPPRIEARSGSASRLGRRGVATFFSRGVDSMYEAALGDRVPRPLTHAIYIDGIEPRHSKPVRTAELELARQAASLLDLEFVAVHTNVRELTNDRRDWGDVCGAALAGIGLAMASGFERVVIPSTRGARYLGPYGSHPSLDERFSTEATTIEHGDVAVERFGKVLAIARDRPDLLPLLKVCFVEDRPDNCGQCAKCLITMSALQAAGALQLATGFPPAIDLNAVRSTRPDSLWYLLSWIDVARGLESTGADGQLRKAILSALERTTRPSLPARARLLTERLLGFRESAWPFWQDPAKGFHVRFANEALSAMTAGRPAEPLARTALLPDPRRLRQHSEHQSPVMPVMGSNLAVHLPRGTGAALDTAPDKASVTAATKSASKAKRRFQLPVILENARIPESTQRVIARFQYHVRRALRAIRAAGPSRHTGCVSGVTVTDRTVTIFGEAHAPGEKFETVIVHVNGRSVGTAQVSSPTPELAMTRPGHPEAALAGWELTVSRYLLPAGTVTIEAYACSTLGLVERLGPLQVSLGGSDELAGVSGLRSNLVGEIDSPNDGAREADGLVVIHGWIAPATSVDQVIATFDDGVVVNARLFCSPRDDLPAQLDDLTAVIPGFEITRAFTPPPHGQNVSFKVEGTGPHGKFLIGSRSVIVDPVKPVNGEDARWIRALEARTASICEMVVPSTDIELAVITHDLGIGGAQLWLDEILTRILGEPDVACTVLAQRDGPLRKVLELAGARVSVIGPLPATGGEYENAVADLIRMFATDRTSIVIANTMTAFIGVDAAMRAGIPAIFAIHEHFEIGEYWAAAFGRAGIDSHVRARAEAAIAGANATCFVADATLKMFERNLNAKNLLHVGYGIPLARNDATYDSLDRNALRSGYGIREGEHLFVEIATVEPRKAQSNVVLALARLLPFHPNLQIAFVGDTGGEYSSRVVALADSLGIGNRVRMVPVTSEVGVWLSMADAFILPSDSESLPRSLMEAMALGVPVIATDVGGVGELVVDGITGVTCAPRDIGKLAEAIDRLLTMNERTLREVRSAASSLVRSRHDVHDYTESYLRLVRGLVKDGSADIRDLLGGA